MFFAKHGKHPNVRLWEPFFYALMPIWPTTLLLLVSKWAIVLKCASARRGLQPNHFHGEYYRRRHKTANRHVATLFGTITLRRFLYQPVEAAERSIFPLEIRLGLAAGIATPALADRVAQYSARCTQNQVREILNG